MAPTTTTHNKVSNQDTNIITDEGRGAGIDNSPQKEIAKGTSVSKYYVKIEK